MGAKSSSSPKKRHSRVLEGVQALQTGTGLLLSTPAANNPCFSYAKVVAALLPCINHYESDVISQYWFFAAGVNFFITSSYLLANSGNNYSTAQSGAMAYGPAISEGAGGATQLTAMDATRYNTYAFKESNTGGICIQVQGGGTPPGSLLAFDGNGAPTLLSEYAAGMQGVSFGILGVNDALLGVTSIMLLYTDITVTTPQAMVLVPANAVAVGSVTSTGTASGCSHVLARPAFFDTLTFDPVTLYAQLPSTTRSPSTAAGPSRSNTDQLVLFRWTLMLAQAPSSLLNASAAAYMSTHCMGTTTEGCRNGGGSGAACTLFLSNSSVGKTCSAASKIDAPTTDAAYKTLCSTAHKDALALLDCSCVNYAQSTYRQPDLNGGQTYPEFQAWLQKNGLPAADATRVSCWWPGCTSSRQAGALTLSTMSATGPAASCPDITDCISAITVSNLDTGAVTKTISDACGAGGAGGGAGAGANNSASATPFLKSKTFTSLIIFVAVDFFCMIVAYVLATTLRPTAPPRLVYIRPEDVARIKNGLGPRIQ